MNELSSKEKIQLLWDCQENKCAQCNSYYIDRNKMLDLVTKFNGDWKKEDEEELNKIFSFVYPFCSQSCNKFKKYLENKTVQFDIFR